MTYQPAADQRPNWGLLAVIALAVVVRTYHIGAQSLWYDEGTSVALAGRSLVEITRNAAHDIHPPLYYWLLALWTRAFGDAVPAVRALSAVLGTAAVGGVYGLGRRLWGDAVAVVAALVAAFSPYLVWYSQEVRMYILAGALAIGLVSVTLNLAPAPRPTAVARPAPAKLRSWLALLVLATAALYSHYFAGASALVVANAIALAAVVRSRSISIAVSPRAWAELPSAAGHGGGLAWASRWIVVQLAAVALFLPWLAYAWPNLQDWPATSPTFSAGFALRTSLAVFAVGSPAPAAVRAWWPLLAVVAAFGLSARGRRGERWPAAVVLLWLMLPPAMLWLLSSSRPSWNPKFLIAAAPAFELALAAGIVLLGRRLATVVGIPGTTAPAAIKRLVATGCVLAVILWPRAMALDAMAHDPAYQRDDYRGISRDITAMAGPQDAVILDAPTQVEVFGYYDRGAHPTYPLPLGTAPTLDEVWAQLDEIGRRQQDFYAVLWATDERDPERLVERWLNTNRYKAFDRWYGNVRLALWAAASGPLSPARIRPERVTFGPELTLLSLRHPVLAVPAGDVLTLELTWAALDPPRADYTVFAQLLDRADQVIAQRDMRPVGGTAHTAQWTVAAPAVTDRVGLLVPFDTSPGAYRLILGLYDGTTGGRLPVRIDGSLGPLSDAYLVGTVQVQSQPQDTTAGINPAGPG